MGSVIVILTEAQWKAVCKKLHVVVAVSVSEEISSTSSDGEAQSVVSDQEAGEVSSVNRWLWRYLYIKQHRKAG